MNIDTAITLNMPGIESRNGSQANSSPTVNNQANSSPAVNNQASSSPTVNNQANSQANENTSSEQKQDPDKTTASSGPVVSGAVGSLVLDDDKNVVVRFYDSKGNVVAQYPPEDYLEMMKEFKQVNTNLFHTTA
jgi:uncharacterized FlaG/YvyC family protein